MSKNVLAIFIVSLTLAACGKPEPVKRSAKSPTPPAHLAQAPTPAADRLEEEKPVYLYRGDRFRDPFIPAGVSTTYQPDAVFDPQRASVKAIILGRRLKTALLEIGGSGSYFVKSGRIFDVMGKFVEGYTAKVLKEKVVILGEADNVYELKIRETAEEEKS